MDFQFKVALRARRDFTEIWQYIAKDDPAAATKFCERLMAAAESLKVFPQKHGALRNRPEIRKVSYDAYIIFYKIDEKSRTVEIIRFWHGARDQSRLRLREEAIPV